jgi:hypothetical protein
MSFRTQLVLVVVLVTSLTGIGAWVSGQTRPQPINPIVISGPDVGFNVTGHTTDRIGNDVVVGQVVVRINGQWVAAQLSGRAGLSRPATN